MEMTHNRWNETCEYLDAVFGQEDEHLAELMPAAIARGVPSIAVSASVGRLLQTLTKMIGAKRIVEVGTLAGYSATWLARGLPKDGELITIEPNDLHAGVSQEGFERAGIADRVRIVREEGLVALPLLVDELGEGTVDLVFLDAIKTEYPDYLPYAKELLRPGGLLVADNTVGSSDWWVTDPEGTNPNRDMVDRFNRMVANDPGFDACCVPIREGVMIARKC